MPATTSLNDDYARLVEPFRGELHAHCYRMLGSSDDAEEALQEALLRAWRGLERFEGRSSLRSWLYRISTNACLDAIQRRKPVVPLDYEPGADPHDLPLVPASEVPSPETEYEQRDAVERAFLVALERLHPLPRAVFVMRTALGFSARETAAALDTTVAAVNSALQRARKALEEPPADNGPGPDALPDGHTRAMVERCTEALGCGDITTVVRLLADEV
jgi:RNA polymerase sigma-70 factor, ECF subfamily